MVQAVATLKAAVETGTTAEDFRKYRTAVFASYEIHGQTLSHLQLNMDGLREDCDDIETVWGATPDAIKTEQFLKYRRETALTKVRDDCVAILAQLRR